jgi:hypothetical protein
MEEGLVDGSAVWMPANIALNAVADRIGAFAAAAWLAGLRVIELNVFAHGFHRAQGTGHRAQGTGHRAQGTAY